jgi:hypothetical protein
MKKGSIIHIIIAKTSAISHALAPVSILQRPHLTIGRFSLRFEPISIKT